MMFRGQIGTTFKYKHSQKRCVSIPLPSKYLFTISFEVYEPLAVNSSNTLYPIPTDVSKLKLGPFSGGQNWFSSFLKVTVSTIGFDCNFEIQTC